MNRTIPDIKKCNFCYTDCNVCIHHCALYSRGLKHSYQCFILCLIVLNGANSLQNKIDCWTVQTNFL